VIINIRGASGSGKSTTVRSIMEEIGEEWAPNYIPGRRKPLYYTCRGVCILGHYETLYGGCDTIRKSCKEVVYLAKSLASIYHVIGEGRLWSDDVKHTLNHLADIPLMCLYLTTSTDECLRRLLERRKKNGNLKPFNPSPANAMERFHKRVESTRLRLMQSGVHCRRVSQLQARRIALNTIRKDIDV